MGVYSSPATGSSRSRIGAGRPPLAESRGPSVFYGGGGRKRNRTAVQGFAVWQPSGSHTGKRRFIRSISMGSARNPFPLGPSKSSVIPGTITQELHTWAQAGSTHKASGPRWGAPYDHDRREPYLRRGAGRPRRRRFSSSRTAIPSDAGLFRPSASSLAFRPL